MIPYSRPKLPDLYTLSQSIRLENPTLHSGTYLYSPYMAVPPPPTTLGTQRYPLWKKKLGDTFWLRSSLFVPLVSKPGVANRTKSNSIEPNWSDCFSIGSVIEHNRTGTLEVECLTVTIALDYISLDSYRFWVLLKSRGIKYNCCT